MKRVAMTRAIRDAIAEEMRRDEKVIVIGLEQSTGSAFGTVAGLAQEFGPERVMDMPIAEEGYTGLAVGAAATGLRPVAEIQFNDWMTIASDQLVNQAAFMKYMYGGSIKMPLTIRTNSGGYLSAAGQHSKSLESWFAYIPGIKVIAPSTHYDAKALLKAAIRDDNLVIFFEHKRLMSTKGEVSEDPECVLPIGKADVKRTGKDVSIITYSYATQLALEAARTLENEGIDVEVLDLRTIKPIDEEAILATARKTGRVLCLQEAWRSCSVMSEVAAILAENAICELKKPIKRITAKEAPIPFSPVLEQHVLPSVEDVVQGVYELVNNK